MARRTKQDWLDLFEAHQASGLTAAAFCRQQGVCAKYFSAKQTQLGWRQPKTHSVFVAAKPQMLTPPAPICVTLRYGQCQLQLNTDIETAWLSTLIKALA